MIKVKVKPINHLWAPLVPWCPGRAALVGRDAWRALGSSRQSSRQGLPGPRAPTTNTALCCNITLLWSPLCLQNYTLNSLYHY